MTDTTDPFGVVLQRFRLRHLRLSQSRLAERAGFDHSYVSRLETGVRLPSRDAVELLAKALDLDQVSRDELLASAGFMPDDVASLLSAEPEITDVLALLQDASVPALYRDSVRQVLRLLVEQARYVVSEQQATTPPAIAS